MRTKVSFWLIPAKEEREFFQKIIDTLAQEYNAPTFTPHVTIYSGEYPSDELLNELIEKAIEKVKSFSLKVDKLSYTNSFTKTLFVQFHQNPILVEISETLRCSSKKSTEFVLNPHLSLIYQYLNEETKKNLTNSIILPKSEFLFDEVRAISTPEKVEKREDVDNWRVICTKKFNFNLN